MNRSRAFFAGVIAASVMSAVMWIGRAMGMPVNLEMMLGSWLTLGIGPITWTIGLAMHLIIGGLFGFVYGAILERTRASSGMGMTLGVAHAVIAGFALGMVPALHPLVGEVIAAPGPYMLNMGWPGAAAFLILHMMYGGVVGGIYQPKVVHVHSHRDVHGRVHTH